MGALKAIGWFFVIAVCVAMAFAVSAFALVSILLAAGVS